ncbi:MFS transporter [Acinetobacter soli]|nr:MFS transporter [Acinetobacter soli]WEI15207.1 MFS transporter [Acinetobacter soli]
MSSSSDFFAALRYRDFSLLSLNQLCLTLAILIQEVVVAYSLYQITKNPLMLGLIGLVELVPFIVLSLWGGYIADYFNRQTILKWGFALTCPIPACLALLFFLHAQQSIELPLFYLAFMAVFVF